jgi:hypothetical protein
MSDLSIRADGDTLLGERDGAVVAAVALFDGAVVSPAAPADAVAALRRRRYQILRQGGDVGRRGALLRRLG